MTWNAMQTTVAARCLAVSSALPALLTAAGLPALAADPRGYGGHAIYPDPQIQYPSPCVEIGDCEGTVQHSSARSVLTELSGWVILSFRSTDSALPVSALKTGYMAALFACFPSRSSPEEYWEIAEVSASPSERQGDATFVQAVAVRVVHQIAEEL